MTELSLRARLPSYRRLVLLLITGLVALISVSTVVQTYAMPVEARQTEPWYAYQSVLGFRFTAKVQQGDYYPSPEMKAADLFRQRLPVEPPQYRRILITKLTESIEVTIPYHFTADREAQATGILSVEAMLVVPQLWQKPYPLAINRTIPMTGKETAGSERFTIPVAALLKDIETAKDRDQINLEPLELYVRPVFEVKVEGLRQPVSVLQNPEYRIAIRRDIVEVDEQREVKAEKNFAETKVVPITVQLFGNEVTVAALRRVSMVSMGVSLTIIALLLLYRKRKRDPRVLLEKLGPSLITAGSFELPTGTAVADVTSVKELLQLHAQTERPVILVGETCYLLDGTTCYRFALSDTHVSEGTPESMKEHEPLGALFAMAIWAEEFTLDPWITSVHVHTAQALLDLHQRTGKSIIRTDKGYHLLDGTVCFTFRPPAEAPEITLAQAAPAEQDD